MASISACILNGACRSTTNTRLSVSWFFVRVPTDREPYVQDSIPTWVSPVRDDNGEWIVSHIINQDIVGWASQGRIADRSHENLRSSDIGITMMRKRFFEDLDRIAKGQDPSSIVRDPAVAKYIALPDAMRKYNVEGVPHADYAKHPLLREPSRPLSAPLRTASGGAVSFRGGNGLKVNPPQRFAKSAFGSKADIRGAF